MVKHYAEYEAVERYPILRGYLDHFRKVSKDNDIPGLLSFFAVQGQLMAPYVRIPMDDIHLDPRVHVFWIQSSRTGKSVSWGFIAKVLRDVGLLPEIYTEGTDAGLIGGWERVETDEGVELTPTEGLLSGHKMLNFDEGSILLKPGKFSQNTVLYLQTACNAIGSEENILKKHTKDGPIELESMVSLWITTYPPQGVKEYVLNKGIFQRVLLFWRDWTVDMRQRISEERVVLPWAKQDKASVDYSDIVDHFTELEEEVIERTCSLSSTIRSEWDEMERMDREDIVQSVMGNVEKPGLLSKDDTFDGAMLSAVDDYYTILRNMDPKLMQVVSSFMPAIENYTIVLAVHLAMLERVWVVNGNHVQMAEEILYDLFQNLILWLEDEVQVGAKAGERRAREAAWKESIARCETFDFDDRRGFGWARKSQLLEFYGRSRNVGRNTRFAHFDKANYMFDSTREGAAIYCRLKEDYQT